MARRVVTQLLDDLDQSPATQTVVFALEGRKYTIDLNDDHAAELRGVLQPYIAAGRRGTGHRGTAVPKKTLDFDPAAVRAWAKSNSVIVSKRGRIPNSVLDRYRAAGF
ncbi:MAG: Lsr2 family protein [Bifidobacteriaceae bacterium]|jgi:hypothetical protein|nr:Lsr2 family protein [Bifidobacteriaceae bacterium]